MSIHRTGVSVDPNVDPRSKEHVCSDKEHDIQLSIQPDMSELADPECTDRRFSDKAHWYEVERRYRKFAALFNFAPIGYLVIDRDGVIHEINLTAAITLDAPRSQLIGRSLLDFIHDDDQDGFYYQKLRCQKNEDTNFFELKMLKVDGVPFDAQLQMQSLSTPYGEEPQYSVALVDISERVQLSSSFALQQQCLEIACSAKGLRALLQAYVKLVKAYLNCDAVGIRIRDQAGNIPYQAYEGFSRSFYDSESPLSLHTDQCMCIAVIKGTTDPEQPYFTHHGSFYINGTSRFLAAVAAEDLGSTRNVCNAHGYESVALIPIQIDETNQGLIHVADHHENHFPLRIVQTLEAVGSRLGLAIQRIQLQEQLRETVDALNHLSSHLLSVQEDEQRRIAMELHDGCGQDLNVLKLRLKHIQNRLPDDAVALRGDCEQLLDYIDKIINDVRSIAHGLKPAALDALGLTVATRQIIREFSVSTGIDVDVELEMLDRIEEPMSQVCLFRIVQEALTNIHKHAQATSVRVDARQVDQSLCIRIQDDGVGFDTRAQSESNGANRGMGLSAMALRCRMIQATLSIDSAVGKGTRLTIRVPCLLSEITP